MKKRIIFIVMLLTMVSSQIALADSGVVTTVSASLRVRQKPSASSSTIGSLVKSAKVNTLGKTGNYYRISYKGKNGYVHSSFIKLMKGSTKTTTPVVKDPINELSAVKVPIIEVKVIKASIIEVPVTKVKPAISANGTNLVTYAYKFLGTPYKNGGTTPAIYNANGRYVSGGFDCSAFVQHVYKNFGIVLPRVTSDQIKKGTAVSTKNLQKEI